VSLHRTLEAAANVSIIVVSLLIGWVVVTKFMGERKVTALPTGKKVALSDVNWKANKRTLIMVLKKGCHVCNESAEFHRRVVDRAREKGVPLIAVLPDQPADARAYIRTLGLQIPDVRQAEMKSLGVAGAPTVILVDQRGAVERAWLGKLPPREEEEVLRVIG
jgi:peroxiredoxin